MPYFEAVHGLIFREAGKCLGSIEENIVHTDGAVHMKGWAILAKNKRFMAPSTFIFVVKNHIIGQCRPDGTICETQDWLGLQNPGSCTFEVSIPSELLNWAVGEVVHVFAIDEDGMAWSFDPDKVSPFIAATSFIPTNNEKIIGYIDQINPIGPFLSVRGWAVSKIGNKMIAPEYLYFSIGENKIIGKCAPNVFRNDVLQSLGETSQELGFCGFKTFIPQALVDGNFLSFSACVPTQGNQIEKLVGNIHFADINSLFVEGTSAKKRFSPTDIESFQLPMSSSKTIPIHSNLKPSTSKEAKEAWNHLVDEDNPEKAFNKATDLQSTHSYYNRLVTGDDRDHFLSAFWQKYFSSSELPVIASLGTGGGMLERYIVNVQLPFKRIDGYELSPVLVAESNRKVREIGASNVTYFEADMNTLALPESTYDLAIFCHSLHHVENLEVCLNALQKGLKKDGLLLVMDYIGPNRLQWKNQQLALAKKMLALLPEKYRVLKDSLQVKTDAFRKSYEEIFREDPSEAPCSETVLSMLQTHFSQLELVSLGGTVINHVLLDITHNFNENRIEDLKLLRLLQDIEQWYEENGYVSVDFIYGVFAQHKKQ